MVSDFLHDKIKLQAERHERPYRVLSLDGGGMRGLYTASVLQSLVSCFSGSDNKRDKDIGKGFDLIVGTSTGGILACGLVAGVPISRIIELYFKKGKKIFTRPFPYREFKQFFWSVRNRRNPANSHKVLIRELKNIFGNKTIGQIYDERQIGLCVTAVGLADHSPKVFKTPHGSSKSSDSNRKLIDICLATSSAPIIFPIAHISDPEGNGLNKESFVDGGLWTNSPVLVALIEAINCSRQDQKIEIISIGTCSPPTGQVVLSKKSGEGILDWRCGIDLMELMMASQSKANHLIAEFLCTQLKTSGREIVINRLRQTAPAVEQTRFLAMDQASKKTCSLLMNFGEKDGKNIYEMSGENELKAIFTNLPDL